MKSVKFKFREQVKKMIKVEHVDPDFGRNTEDENCKAGRTYGWVVSAKFKSYPDTIYFLKPGYRDYTADPKEAGVFNDRNLAEEWRQRCAVNYVTTSVHFVESGKIKL